MNQAFATAGSGGYIADRQTNILYEREKKEIILDMTQFILDLTGMVEPTPFSDGSNALISIARGNWFDAVISSVSMIPYLGDLAKIAKFPKYLKSIRLAIKIARNDTKWAMALGQLFTPLRKLIEQLIDVFGKKVPDKLLQIKSEIDDFMPSALKGGAGPGETISKQASERFAKKQTSPTQSLQKPKQINADTGNSIQTPSTAKTQSSTTQGKPNKCTTSCNDPIDVATGEFLDSRTDFTIPATLPIVFNRNYRTQSIASGLLGKKWSTTWSQHLKIKGKNILFHNEEGEVITFHCPELNINASHLRHPHLMLKGHQLDVITLFNQREQLNYQFSQHEEGIFNLEKISDRHHNHIILHYDQHGLSKINHSDGIELSVQSKQGQIQKVQLVETGKPPCTLVSYQYKKAYLSQVKSFQNGIFNYTYDYKGRILSWSDTTKTHVFYTYDDLDRVIATGSKSGHHQGKLSYDKRLKCTEVQYPDTKTETYYFNKDGLVTLFIDGRNNEWKTEWDNQFNIVSQTNPLGYWHQYSYDKQSQLISHTDPEGRISQYTYHSDGLLKQTTDAEGKLWQYSYDDKGNLKTLTNPLGEKEHYQYASNGQTIKIEFANDGQQRLEYDQNFRPNNFYDAKGNRHLVCYDSLGRLQQQEDALGHITRYQYNTSEDNQQGNISQLINPDQSKINLSYDQEGQLTSYTDAEGNTTNYQHGAFDLLESSTDPKNQTLCYEYDGETRFKAVINQNNERYSYEYDDAGNVIKETDFSGLITYYLYDKANQLIEKQDPDNTFHQYRYDRSGLLIQKSSQKQSKTTQQIVNIDKAIVTKYQYNKNGQLIFADNNEVQLGYQYDALGRMIKETIDNKEITSHYQKGQFSRSERRGDVDNLKFSYDLNDQLQQMIMSEHQPLNIQRDCLGHEISRQSAIGFISVQSHDNMGRLSQQLAGNTQQLAELINLDRPDPLKNLGDLANHNKQLEVSRQYRWDRNHNPLEITDNRRGKQQYSYDARQQIEHSQFGITKGQQPNQEHFSYSNGQQIEQRSTEKGTQTYHYLPGGRILRLGFNQYDYDNAGRVIKKTETKPGFRPQIWHYHWNAEGQLAKLTTAKGESWHYRYDAMGRRIRKFKSCKTNSTHQPSTDNKTATPDNHLNKNTAISNNETIGIHYLWEGNNLIQQAPLYADGTIAWDQAEEWIYEPDQMVPMAKRSADGTLFYVITDHLGTPKELLSEDGSHTAWAGQQNTWGKFTGNIANPNPDKENSLEAAANEAIYKTDCPIRFQGQWEDEESGLHYNRYRYYDPDVGQYISPDPIGLAGGSSPQGYVSNPNGWVDPLGLAGCSSVTKRTTILGENMKDIVIPYAKKTGARTLPFGTTAEKWSKLSPKQRFKLNDGALRKRINEGDNFKYTGADPSRNPAMRKKFDLTSSELLRLKDRGLSYETVTP